MDFQTPFNYKPFPILRPIEDKTGGYLGWALPTTKENEAGWVIIKISDTASLFKMNHANQSTKLDKVWDDRAIYDYDPDA